MNPSPHPGPLPSVRLCCAPARCNGRGRSCSSVGRSSTASIVHPATGGTADRSVRAPVRLLTALTTAAILLALNIANAQRVPEGPMVGSVSGQFFVSSRTASLSAQSLKLAAQPNMVALQPALLVVSCERIKQELVRTLAMHDDPAGKIFINLQPAQSTADAVDIVPERFAGNWNCHVRLPDVIDQDRLAEIIVRASLLEIANRNAVDHSAEIPEWLSQGLARQVIASREEELILQPPD